MHRQIDRAVGAEGHPPNASQPAERVEFIEILQGQPGQFSHVQTGAELPRLSTPLIGRSAEIEQLTALLRDAGRRLITITGPGGVGKTRLALEIARTMSDSYADGLAYISLAPVRDPDLVIPAIALGIGLHAPRKSGAFDGLVTSLHEQRTLLVLDNFEQVNEAAVDISHLLAACPRLQLLITSRAALRVSEETLFPTAPLSIEAEAFAETQSGAADLFVDRARRADSDFRLTAQNSAIVLDICKRLEGLPLAIELAAARVSAVSPAELLERLDPRLPVLTEGNRDLPERQQTMRSAIAWSYELLGESERRLFRWLSVFVGGFRLSAAESIAGAMARTESAAGNSGATALVLISTLVANSLLHRLPNPRGESRFAMLEVVREFGLELLEAHGELDAARTAHADWCIANREWLDPNRYRAGETLIDHLWDIDAENPNLRAALANCDVSGDYRRMLDIAGALAVFWHHRGFLGEGRAWLELALERAIDPPPESLCWALAGLGLIRWSQADPDGAEPVLLRSLQLAQALEHRELQALSLHVLALVDLDREIHARSRDRIEIALLLWRELGLPSDEAMALHILSFLPPRPGDPDRRLEDALASWEIFESIGHTSGIAHVHFRLGRLSQSAGDDRLAFDHYASAVEIWLSIDDRWSVNRSLVMLTEMAASGRQWDCAAALAGVIESRQRISDSELSQAYRTIFERALAQLETELGRAAFQSRRREGSKLSAEQINALIEELRVRLFGQPVLTKREREVLQRMAAGETDREIAVALFVSHRTVHTHVSHVLTKLDVNTRREAVRRGHELGLIDTSLVLGAPER